MAKLVTLKSFNFIPNKEKIVRTYMALVKTLGHLPSWYEIESQGNMRREMIRNHFRSMNALKLVINQIDPKLLQGKLSAKEQQIQSCKVESDKILKIFVELTKKHRRYPSRKELLYEGRVTPTYLRRHFVSAAGMKIAAMERYGKELAENLHEVVFTQKKFRNVKTEVKKYKRFVVSSVVTHAVAHKGFLDSIHTFCKENDATLLLLPISDPSSISSTKDESIVIDPQLKDETLVFSDLALNQSLLLSTIKLSAKQIEPITGLARIGQRHGSFIYASTKQRMKPVAVGMGHPHVLMTTGAITLPDYETSRYLSDRTAYIARYDHVIGAIVVEIEDSKHFHYRQIQADENGCFVDLGTLYTPKGTKSMPPSAIVFGDYHTGSTDPQAKKATKEIIEFTKATVGVFHDIFDGKSINYFDEVKHITQALKSQEHKGNLAVEIADCAKEINEWSDILKTVVIVKSNHDERLEKYLEESRYIKDPPNMKIGTKLAFEMLEHKSDPLRVGMEDNGLKRLDKLVWLQRDDSFVIGGVELGAHGDHGNNGAKRANLVMMEKSYGACVVAHHHTPEILRGAWCVGTLSFLRLEYNRGPSSWMHTDCLIYPNGQRQLINVIQGKWRVK